MQGNSSNKQKKLSETYRHQINIMRALTTGTITHDARPVQLEQIAEASGLKDEPETQRFLYILEGQKLVAPHPAGDFTSRHWQITQDGLKALKSIGQAA